MVDHIYVSPPWSDRDGTLPSLMLYSKVDLLLIDRYAVYDSQDHRVSSAQCDAQKRSPTSFFERDASEDIPVLPAI